VNGYSLNTKRRVEEKGKKKVERSRCGRKTLTLGRPSLFAGYGLYICNGKKSLFSYENHGKEKGGGNPN